jgi:flagellar hook-length control protein FliK
MMSAKTVLTETPACPVPSAPGSSATAPSADGAPSDFQSLLAGAAPAAVPLVKTPPAAALMQLLDTKLQQQGATLANPAAAAPASAAGKSPAATPADLLKILTDSTALGATDGAAADAVAEDPRDSEELAAADEDILAEWLDMMLPASVLAPQAGASNSVDAKSTQMGEGEPRQGGAATVLPMSLVAQAGLPDTLDSLDAKTTAAQGIPLTVNREAAAAAAQTSAAAFTAALVPKIDTAEREAPETESWMSAMGDLTSKRAPDTVPLAEARLSTPVQDARWADALAHRLVMMARDGESVASLKLVPVDLGPLDIQISVRDGEASVHFGAAHQETRAALEASMPRLRELLSAQGLQLSNASVSHQSAGQNRPERSSPGARLGAVADDTEVAGAKVISTSLLDTYA